MKNNIPTLVALALAAVAAPVLATSCQVVSPANTVALIELFTSEGCSSCPPADQWLSTLKRGAGFDKLVPLSLHVNYWDYIGWKDPYADAQFTERQRNYARLRGTTTIYTPQVVLDGHDYPAWSGRSFDKTVQAINGKLAPIALNLKASATAVKVSATAVAGAPASSSDADAAKGGDLVDINVTTTAVTTTLASARPLDDLKLFLAVFDNTLISKVTRGENAGSTLSHDFVVRRFTGPLPVSAAATQRLAVAAAATTSQRGVAAFVQNARGEVLQATACLLQ